MRGKDALLPSNANEEAREANLDAILSGSVSLSSLLMPSFDNNITASSFYRPADQRTFKDPPPLLSPNFSSLFDHHHLFKSCPKSEPSDNIPPQSHFLLPPFPQTMTINPAPFHFHHLPHLRSLDTHNKKNLIISSSSSSGSSPHKRPRHQLPIVNNNNNVGVARHHPVPTSALARQRRSRMSDKTRCLQKLIPLDRQMDTATLYEETYKYVKFLEAQISILQSMPVHAPSPLLMSTNAPGLFDGIFGGLGRLNRQQLLQVLVNSPVAQTVMYANGWCVFYAEQLASLIRTDREKVVEQQFLL